MKDKKNKKDANGVPRIADGVGRRDIMKMGIGAGVAAMTGMLNTSTVSAEAQDAQFTPPPTASGGASMGVPGGAPYVSPHSPTRRVVRGGSGYKNTSGRSFGNGPMDETSSRIVSYVHSFSAPNVTDQAAKDIGIMLLDTIGCGISAFETDSARAGAKVARFYPGGQLKSTVWGYGVDTTPEMAGFVGSCMVRHFDNNNAGMHETDIIPGIFAVGEALHSSGPQVLEAMIVGWEVFAALLTAQPATGAPGNRGVWSTIDNWVHAPAMAMAAGKLMGLNEDQLGNALSLSFIGHMALGVDHWEGPNSMSKSNHDAELVRSGIFAALCAREGMTGPAQPFEGGKGLWDVVTGPFKMKIPAKVGGNPMLPLGPSDNRYVIQTLEFKPLPGNGGVPISQVIPPFRKFAKVDEIESIEIQTRAWGDGADPGKWDPLNSETADHSLAYCFARLLMDGDLFLDAYTKEKMADPAIRQLMAKITIQENPDIRRDRVTVRKKTGEELVEESGAFQPPMTVEEIHKKFDRICAYRSVTNEQRDRIRNTWADMRGIKDVAEPIRTTLARFGKPLPL